MDYLDTFDVDSTDKKCHRVRSWYLYEQYKTLEKNQLDAVQLLKSKSYQNSILRQELKERRARRKLCDQYGLCQSELKLNSTVQSCPSASADDLFESLCESLKEYEVDDLKDNCICDDSQTSKNDDNNEIENKIDDFSDSESIQSVIDNVIIKENSPHNVKEELEIVKKNIAKNISWQLETVKENMECLEMFTKHNEDYFRENSNVEELNDTKKFKNKTQNIFENLFSIWSNLVVFASNSIKLNPGNCYCQCSSQLLTAVLACDFIRKSVDGICHILQSYVSPIKFATSDSESSLFAPHTYKELRMQQKKKDKYLTTYKSIGSKHCSCDRYIPKTFERRCCSENKYNSNNLPDNQINERICRGASEPWRSTYICDNKNVGKHSRKPLCNFRKFSNKNHCNCNYLKVMANSSLKVARYIDKILQHVEDTPLWL